MPTEDDAFLLRARHQDRLTAEPASFGLAMMELVATDSVPLSGAISATAKQLLTNQVPPFLAAEEPVAESLAVPEVKNG